MHFIDKLAAAVAILAREGIRRATRTKAFKTCRESLEALEEFPFEAAQREEAYFALLDLAEIALDLHRCFLTIRILHAAVTVLGKDEEE